MEQWSAATAAAMRAAGPEYSAARGLLDLVVAATGLQVRAISTLPVVAVQRQRLHKVVTATCPSSDDALALTAPPPVSDPGPDADPCHDPLVPDLSSCLDAAHVRFDVQSVALSSKGSKPLRLTYTVHRREFDPAWGFPQDYYDWQETHR